MVSGSGVPPDKTGWPPTVVIMPVPSLIPPVLNKFRSVTMPVSVSTDKEPERVPGGERPRVHEPLISKTLMVGSASTVDVPADVTLSRVPSLSV